MDEGKRVVAEVVVIEEGNYHSKIKHVKKHRTQQPGEGVEPVGYTMHLHQHLKELLKD